MRSAQLGQLLADASTLLAEKNMPKKNTAGILMYRYRGPMIEVFLVHPGGPFWTKKDAGSWSVPKGQIDENEDPLDAARREFEEETGFAVDGDFTRLEPVKQAGGKVVHTWAIEGDCNAEAIKSNMFSMEWPPRSGKRQEFPEVDRAGWFSVETAKGKILKAQIGLLEDLQRKIGSQKPVSSRISEK
jgi:predicted NUDIX family NTP pyrophosphohydrolase